MRGRIDRDGCLIHRHIDNLMLQIRTLARSPAALPIAFVCGILAGRLYGDTKCTDGLLASLAGQVRAWQIASSLIGSSVR